MQVDHWPSKSKFAALSKSFSAFADPAPALTFNLDHTQQNLYNALNSRYLTNAYTFEIELIDSDDPTITRTVDVPCNFTFHQLHHVLLCGFAWMNSHMHKFSFEGKGKCVEISGDEPMFDDIPTLDEKQVKLSDIFDASGCHRSKVLQDGGLLPLVYEYDFGDSWEHFIEFKGEKEIDVNRPVFTAATGYPPAEDCGGMMGWDRVKAAFAEKKPDGEERELREWAIELMAKPDGSDPFWPTKRKYNPLKEVDLKVLNSARRWNQITNMDYY
ncbi:hypothetical protein AAF712_004721 [Marasmius tenuissimus]|uniref:Plasmid pRiA4b Orf3-like domain-containing protein n=1 Tax=Marasmius tenuissimus TaxID=585030 RepID=A0ABR3A5Q1_9AGAR